MLKTVFLFICVLLTSVYVAGAKDQVANDKDTSYSNIPDSVVIKELIITGNKVTKLQIITRELYFHEGDSMQGIVFLKAVDRSRENLINTLLFNFVTITYTDQGGGNMLVLIDLKERWYFFPIPIFELADRNFNEWWQTKDFSRINYGVYLTWNNFRGLNERLRLLLRWGYTRRIGLQYTIPYINKNQKEGAAIGITYSRAREVAYNVSGSKLVFYKNPESFVTEEFSTYLLYTQRSGFYNTNIFSVEYRQNNLSDTVAKLNPDYFGNGVSDQKVLSLAWTFRRDKRDYKVYPLKGYLFQFEAVKHGIGVMENEPDLMYLSSYIKYYKQLSRRFYTAAWVQGKVSGKSFTPYFNQRGFGYKDELVRGYELYVVPGQNYLLTRTTLKFALLPTQKVRAEFIPLEKFRTIPVAFYLNVFGDVGYVRDRQWSEINPISNKYQFGYGAGIDYVTYYSLVFRVEYSINKFGEQGFFLHFTAPI
jgi:outer membrane protein assembly factor BamA